MATSTSSGSSFIPDYIQQQFLYELAQYTASIFPSQMEWARQQYARGSMLAEQLIDRGRAYLNPQFQAQRAGRAQADVMARTEQVIKQAQDKLRLAGADPSSGKMEQMILAEKTKAAANAVGAGNMQVDADIKHGEGLEMQGINARLAAQGAYDKSVANARGFLDTASALKYPPLGHRQESKSESTGGGGGSSGKKSPSDGRGHRSQDETSPPDPGYGRDPFAGGPNRGDGGPMRDDPMLAGGRDPRGPGGDERGPARAIPVPPSDNYGQRPGDQPSGGWDESGFGSAYGPQYTEDVFGEAAGGDYGDDYGYGQYGDESNWENEWSGYGDYGDESNWESYGDDYGYGEYGDESNWESSGDDYGYGEYGDESNWETDDYGYGQYGDESNWENQDWEGYGEYGDESNWENDWSGYGEYGDESNWEGSSDYYGSGWDESGWSDYSDGGGWDESGWSDYSDYSSDWADYGDYAHGGPVSMAGKRVPPSMSPSRGRRTDDVRAQVAPGGGEARINVGEYVIPEEVVRWKGQEFFDKLIAQSRKLRGETQNAPQQGSDGVPRAAMGGSFSMTRPRGAVQSAYRGGSRGGWGRVGGPVSGPMRGPVNGPMMKGGGYSGPQTQPPAPRPVNPSYGAGAPAFDGPYHL